MKTCCTCGETKPLEEFYKQSKAKDGRQSQCRVCQLAYRSRYYKEHQETENARKVAYRNRDKEWYLSLKAGKPCVDCGQVFHPAAMHWDHKDGEVKVKAVARLFNGYRSKEKILAEIAKCELRCANCHAVRTWNSAYYKLQTTT